MTGQKVEPHGEASQTNTFDKEKQRTVRTSVTPICDRCKVIKREGKVMVICPNKKHKQTQG